jgi:hypothetical protein
MRDLCHKNWDGQIPSDVASLFLAPLRLRYFFNSGSRSLATPLLSCLFSFKLHRKVEAKAKIGIWRADGRLAHARVCSCEDTMPLDVHALPQGCRNGRLVPERQFCRAETSTDS